MRTPSVSGFVMLAGLSLVLGVAGCGSQDQSTSNDSIVLYSGRSRSLIKPLIQQFEEKTGISVDVKYGRGPQLVETLSQEGEYGSADVFWANTAGTLGTASKRNLLQDLPDSILDQADAFVPESGQWVPVTARFRVLAYNPETVDKADLPESVLDLPELEQFEGRIGWTPNYTSFQDFVSALRLQEGEEAAGQWIEQLKALNPKSYASNTPMVRDLAAGEIDMALTNHYYVHRLKYGGAEGEYEGHEEEEEEHEHEEEHSADADAPVEIHHFAAGDAGNLALVTGAAMAKGSDNDKAARRFLKFLLSEQAQRFAADTVHEYPVRQQIELPKHLLPMDRVLDLSPALEFERLRDELEPTLKLLREKDLS